MPCPDRTEILIDHSNMKDLYILPVGNSINNYSVTSPVHLSSESTCTKMIHGFTMVMLAEHNVG